jgi:membrane protein implicated in regulation of membrane protease activity
VSVIAGSVAVAVILLATPTPFWRSVCLLAGLVIALDLLKTHWRETADLRSADRAARQRQALGHVASHHPSRWEPDR